MRSGLSAAIYIQHFKLPTMPPRKMVALTPEGRAAERARAREQRAARAGARSSYRVQSLSSSCRPPPSPPPPASASTRACSSRRAKPEDLMSDKSPTSAWEHMSVTFEQAMADQSANLDILMKRLDDMENAREAEKTSKQ
jgi:hypothetical protein